MENTRSEVQRSQALPRERWIEYPLTTTRPKGNRRAKEAMMAKTKRKARRVAKDPKIPDRCRALKEDGSRCRITHGISEDGLCLWHDPKRAEQRKAAQKKGGRVFAERVRDPVIVPKPIESLDDCVIWTAWTAQAIATGVLDPKRGGEITRAVTAFMKAAEKRDLERQVRELQAMVKRLKKEGER